MYAFFASLNSMWLYLSAAFGKLFGWLLLFTFFYMGTQNRLHTLIRARYLSIKMAFYISKSMTWAHGDTDVKEWERKMLRSIVLALEHDTYFFTSTDFRNSHCSRTLLANSLAHPPPSQATNPYTPTARPQKNRFPSYPS